jgi:hypothetical protein
MLVSPLIFRLAGTAAQFKEIIVRSGGCMTDNYAESLGKRIAEDQELGKIKAEKTPLDDRTKKTGGLKYWEDLQEWISKTVEGANRVAGFRALTIQADSAGSDEIEIYAETSKGLKVVRFKYDQNQCSINYSVAPDASTRVAHLASGSFVGHLGMDEELNFSDGSKDVTVKDLGKILLNSLYSHE